MPKLLTFICPELDLSYEAVYQELASCLEIDLETAVERFAPDDAAARVRYHRRQTRRRSVQAELAEALGIDPAAVFAACGEEGARILLEALRAKPRWSIATTRADAPAAVPLLDEIEDAMAR
jgi:hypothetical protein